VYIAGDDKQAIYGFRGADPKYFTETPVTTEEHGEVSRRVPSRIMEAACSLFDGVDAHDVSNVSSLSEGGHVSHVRAEEAADLATLVQESTNEHDTTYLLARTNRQAFKFAWALREEGVPYTGVKENGPLGRWSHPLPALLKALRALSSGGTLRPVEMEALLENSGVGQAAAALRALPSDDGEYGDDALADVFGEVPTAKQAFRRLDLDEWREELLRNTLRSGATNDPDDVKIGTVHSVKGLEAESVMLSPAYSAKMLESYREGDAVEEHRLFYVGMTRAKESLQIVHGFHGGEEFPPLAEGTPL
jgi:superfamily I DNA/RNA helicase